MNQRALYDLAVETARSLAVFYPDARARVRESGLGRDFFTATLAVAREPEPFTVHDFYERIPYIAAERRRASLRALAKGGFAKEIMPDAFCLTPRGRETVRRIVRAVQAELERAAPLPEGELARLAGLLGRLVDAALAAPEPPGKSCLRYSRWSDPGPGARPLALVDQYLSDLACFRDDAHIAAWQLRGVSGEAWEALTYIWRGDARTAAELAIKLSSRAHSVAGYEQALADLADLGWVEEEPGQPGIYRLAEKGRHVRERAEGLTDVVFFAPWQALSHDEQRELGALLGRLRVAATAHATAPAMAVAA